ncbi:MAG TPA: methyltransferase domain-containing protein [Pirellulales bacterium]|nr:methyltransferase domain-containing protein [Pirellulales bacterium]
MNAPPNSQQIWDAGLYDKRHSFVYQYGADLLELLAPRAGERILDLGCGAGHLTAQIAERGAESLGLDASPEMIDQARRNHPERAFAVADATQFEVAEPFDAVFSNAVLHWVKPPEKAVERITAALKPGGRFVAEFGGQGNVAAIIEAAGQAVSSALSRDAGDVNPWYFPSIGQYAALLEAFGLEVRYATLFDRPTRLNEGEQGLANWLEMFGAPCFTMLVEADRPRAITDAVERARPRLFREGQWTADYRRLRVVAIKTFPALLHTPSE